MPLFQSEIVFLQEKRKGFFKFSYFFFPLEKIIICVKEHNLFNFLSQEGENSHLRTSPSSLPRFVSFKNGSWLVPGEGDGTPLQYSCLENSMDGGAW